MSVEVLFYELPKENVSEVLKFMNKTNYVFHIKPFRSWYECAVVFNYDDKNNINDDPKVRKVHLFLLNNGLTTKEVSIHNMYGLFEVRDYALESKVKIISVTGEDHDSFFVKVEGKPSAINNFEIKATRLQS